MRRRPRRIAAAALLLAAMSVGHACGSPPPPWVRQESVARRDATPGMLYGVGSVAGVRNEPLAWEVAEHRARAALLRELRTYLASVQREHGAASDAARRAGDGDVARAVKTLAADSLRGVHSYERYKDPARGIYYVTVRMDVRHLRQVRGR